MPLSRPFTTDKTPIFKPVTESQDKIGVEQLGARQKFSAHITKHPFAFGISIAVLVLQFIKNHIQKANELKPFNELTKNIALAKDLKVDEKIDSNHSTIEIFVSDDFYIKHQDSYVLVPDTAGYNNLSTRLGLDKINQHQEKLTTGLEGLVSYLEAITKRYPEGIKSKAILRKIKNDISSLLPIIEYNLRQFDSFKEPTNTQNAEREIIDDIAIYMPKLADYYNNNDNLVKATWLAAEKIIAFNLKNPLTGIENQIKEIDNKLE
jgi:hypothetical protein